MLTQNEPFNIEVWSFNLATENGELYVPVEGERSVRQGGDAAVRGGDAHEALQEEDARHHRHGWSGTVRWLCESRF